jgi:hypothetical protein
VTTALYEAGYGLQPWQVRYADARLGMTPDAYRRGGPAVAIDFTVIDCPVGRLAPSPRRARAASAGSAWPAATILS